MESLESIDFSSNQLTGEIPQSITNLNFLNKLDLSYNHLEGKIPMGTQLQSFEASDFVGNKLCGPPLLLNCTMDGKVPDDDANDNEKERKNHGVNGILGICGSTVHIQIMEVYAYYRFLDDDVWYKLQSSITVSNLVAKTSIEYKS
ncbi:receptor-like protein 2 [Arachis ipaensis]|uniref:receptor-like protein 2 n=1 Tax=Arachis ipaensis TaxID=130454 RepID=UPI000A2B7551|nr:receptor-like protein 2 [Arachis ipaensis]XP_029147136.1 receptor-like protein EIX2 [Arachis hypogaea]